VVRISVAEAGRSSAAVARLDQVLLRALLS